VFIGLLRNVVLEFQVNFFLLTPLKKLNFSLKIEFFIKSAGPSQNPLKKSIFQWRLKRLVVVEDHFEKLNF